MDRSAIAVAPNSRAEMHDAFCAAVRRAGGTVVEPAQASGLMMADPFNVDQLPELLAAGPDIAWVQLPFAGSSPFLKYVTADRLWTCGKGVYAPPVAEHVLALALGGLRHVVGYARATSWGPQVGRNLRGANVTILGGGGIAEELLKLLAPFDCDTTIVRRSSEPLAGASRTIGRSRLFEVLPRTDVLVVAWALTPETRGVINHEVFAALPSHAWIVNVGRGGHIVTDDLVTALAADAIGGAALDVTDPEPLPDGHPLWSLPNCVITPHVGNTLAMGLPLIAERVEKNVRRWIAGAELLGILDPVAGY